MKVTAKTQYACIAMLELAERFHSGQLVSIRSIAGRHGIPVPYLVQILLQLKAAGLVVSVRGAAGGYRLTKKPEDVSLGTVMAVIDGTEQAPAGSASPESTAARVVREAWTEAIGVKRDMLDSITFEELTRRAQISAGDMYYI